MTSQTQISIIIDRRESPHLSQWNEIHRLEDNCKPSVPAWEINLIAYAPGFISASQARVSNPGRYRPTNPGAYRDLTD